MKEFVFSARDRGGKLVEGRIAADSSALAVARLRSQGLEVERIRLTEEAPTPSPQSGGSVFARSVREVVLPVASGVSLKDLAILYRQLATLVDAGMPLYQALVSLEAQTRNARLKAILRECQVQVMAGGRLSDVLDRHRYVFSSLQLDMIRAAEQAGAMAEMLSRLADYLERELNLRGTISRLTLYPKIVLLVALFILGRSFFRTGMLAFSQLIIGSLGRSPYTALNYFRDTLLVLVQLVMVWFLWLIVVRTVLYRSPSAREGWERMKLAVPGIGGVVRAFALTRFGRAFSALYAAGVPLGNALQSAAHASGSVLIANAVEQALYRIDRGEQLSAALAGTGVLHPMFLDMLKTGEQTGNMDTMIAKASDYLESDAETRAYQYSHVFTTSVYLLVALLVGFAVVSFYLGYASGYGG